MIKPKILVMSGYGINCEDETKFAFELAGAEKVDIVHINDLIDGSKNLENYQIVAFPGGFAYGDDTGAGNAFANKLRNHMWDDFMKFINRDTLTIGICNGFQVLTSLGIFTTKAKTYGERMFALMPNANARYTVRWVDLGVDVDSHFFRNIDTISLPIAHGEGRFFTPERSMNDIKDANVIAARYIKGEMCEFQQLTANPNGSLEDVASIIDISGRIMGLMPHPERAIFFTQLPNWTSIKYSRRYENEHLPKFGPGLKIFENMVSYFS